MSCVMGGVVGEDGAGAVEDVEEGIGTGTSAQEGDAIVGNEVAGAVA